MKKFLTTLVLISGLAASAQAAVIVGADAGYLVDSEEEFFSARVGFEISHANAFSHQLELEVGYTDTKDGGIKSDLVPLMLNYRLAANVNGPWGYTLGGGAGITRARIDGVSIYGPIKLRDEAFSAQAFAGVTYATTDKVTFSLGAKYLWIDDVTFVGQSFEVGDDVAITAGISFKF